MNPYFFNAQATETPIEAIQKHNNFSEVLKFLLKADTRDTKKHLKQLYLIVA